jgi:hypothetical protein
MDGQQTRRFVTLFNDAEMLDNALAHREKRTTRSTTGARTHYDVATACLRCIDLFPSVDPEEFLHDAFVHLALGWQDYRR